MPKPMPFTLKSSKKPYIPSKVDLSDLDQNGFLVPSTQTDGIRGIVNEGKKIHPKAIKETMAQTKLSINKLKSEIYAHTINLQAIDSLVSAIENLEEDIKKFSRPMDEEERLFQIKSMQEQENYIAILEKKIESKVYNTENDETEKSVTKELTTSKKRLAWQTAELNRSPEYLEKIQQVIEERQEEMLSLKEELIAKLLTVNQVGEEEAPSLETPVEKIAALAKQPLEVKISTLERTIQESEQLIKTFEEQLLSTNSKLRKNYLQTRNVDTKFSTLVVHQEDEFKLFTVYFGADKGKSLGSGKFGTVKIAQDEEGNFWAIKYLSSPRALEPKHPEFEILEKLQETGGRLQFESIKHMTKYKYGVDVIVMKLAPGVPLDKLPNNTTSDFGTIEKLEAITDSILSLHQKRIIHFDLKQENILYDSVNKKATIIDYGTAQIIPENKEGFFLAKIGEEDSQEAVSFRGTPLFAPKEMRDVLFAAKYFYNHDIPPDFIYTPAFDVYTAGILMAEHLGLTESKYLKEAAKDSEYLQVVTTASEQFINNQAIRNPTLRKEVLSMLQKMTSDNPEERPTMEAVKHFFSEKKNAFIMKEELIKTAVINIDDYKKLTPEEKSIVRQSLKRYEEVILVSPHETIEVGLKDSIYIRKEFEDQGIMVSEDVFYGSNSAYDIVLALPERDNQRSFNSYSFVSVNNHKVQEKPINLSALNQEVISHLKGYRNQMGIPLEHKKILNQAIGKLEKEKLGVNEIKETLDEVQRKTGSKLATNFKSQLFKLKHSEDLPGAKPPINHP